MPSLAGVGLPGQPFNDLGSGSAYGKFSAAVFERVSVTMSTTYIGGWIDALVDDDALGFWAMLQGVLENLRVEYLRFNDPDFGPISWAMDPDDPREPAPPDTPFPKAGGWTRKWPREITSPDDPGETGWVARLINYTSDYPALSGTPDPRNGKMFIYIDGEWVQAVDPYLRPDVLSGFGLIQPGDFIGQWYLDDLRKAIELFDTTYGSDTPYVDCITIGSDTNAYMNQYWGFSSSNYGEWRVPNDGGESGSDTQYANSNMGAPGGAGTYDFFPPDESQGYAEDAWENSPSIEPSGGLGPAAYADWTEGVFELFRVAPSFRIFWTSPFPDPTLSRTVKLYLWFGHQAGGEVSDLCPGSQEYNDDTLHNGWNDLGSGFPEGGFNPYATMSGTPIEIPGIWYMNTAGVIGPSLGTMPAPFPPYVNPLWECIFGLPGEQDGFRWGYVMYTEYRTVKWHFRWRGGSGLAPAGEGSSGLGSLLL